MTGHRRIRYTEQANEMNPRVRQQILFKMQQLIHEKVMFGPVIEPAFLNGSARGSRSTGSGSLPTTPTSGPMRT